MFIKSPVRHGCPMLGVVSEQINLISKHALWLSWIRHLKILDKTSLSMSICPWIIVLACFWSVCSASRTGMFPQELCLDKLITALWETFLVVFLPWIKYKYNILCFGLSFLNLWLWLNVLCFYVIFLRLGCAFLEAECEIVDSDRKRMNCGIK